MSSLEQRKSGAQYLQVEEGYYVSLREYIQSVPVIPSLSSLMQLFPKHTEGTIQTYIYTEEGRRFDGGQPIPIEPPESFRPSPSGAGLRRDESDRYSDTPPLSASDPIRTPQIPLAQFLRALASIPSAEILGALFFKLDPDSIKHARNSEIKRRREDGKIVPLDESLHDRLPQNYPSGVTPIFATRPKERVRTEFDPGADDDVESDGHTDIRRAAAMYVPSDSPEISNYNNPLSTQELAIIIARLMRGDPVHNPLLRRSIIVSDGLKQALYPLSAKYEEQGSASKRIEVVEDVASHIRNLVLRGYPLFNFPQELEKYGAVLAQYLENEFRQR